MIGTGEDVSDLIVMLVVFVMAVFLFLLSVAILMNAGDGTMETGEGSLCCHIEGARCCG
jgi:hypothetical protein